MVVSPDHYITLTEAYLWQNDTGLRGGDIPAGELTKRGCLGLTWMPLSFFEFPGFLIGPPLPIFALSDKYSFRETNAQPTPATGLFKGFGMLAQQAKTDFRQPRRKSVLSICGNKYTACHY